MLRPGPGVGMISTAVVGSAAMSAWSSVTVAARNGCKPLAVPWNRAVPCESVRTKSVTSAASRLLRGDQSERDKRGVDAARCHRHAGLFRDRGGAVEAHGRAVVVERAADVDRAGRGD